MTTVIYIAGYGRSGSTVIELALSAHPRVLGVGELAYFGREYSARRACACGSPLSDCPFWGRVLERANLRPREIGIKGPAARRLLAVAAETAGCDFVVDSSKSTRRTFTRPMDLAVENNLFVVHLIRSPAAVAGAAVVGTNEQQEGGRVAGSPALRWLRTLAGWTAANRAARWLSMRERSMVVRFEQFLENPSRTVSDILTSAGLDPAPVTEQLTAHGPLAVGHGVGGNRLRRTGEPVVIRASSVPTSAASGYRAVEYLAGVRLRQSR